ncbi:MAG: peptidoglycan DD-metalloendopeptidase family protein, partial [Flavobacteriaceae bacterium]
YTLLFTKDSVPTPKAFIYHPDVLGYRVVQLRDSIYGKQVNKLIRTVELQATGVIKSSLYETMQKSGYNSMLTYFLADVYAWTIDFTRLDKGDRFKVIYTEKFVDDSISVGIEKIKAAYFEHRGKGLYAFEFETDSIKGIVDYFDENAKNLRRAFLKAPVKFSRISSRYNLKRRIAYYGRVKPHKGTDYAAPVGTPIMATANGKITKSSYTKGNGNYVKIRHNNTYSTQYLHMKRRKVRVGQYVKQGDVIGWVGMTGNTSGPHVCYRFWKNGRQVDPYRQKLPEAKPISPSLKKDFFAHIAPIKTQLNCLFFEKEETSNIAMY